MVDWYGRFREHGSTPALMMGGMDAPVTYGELSASIGHWLAECERSGIASGSVVAFPARYDLHSVSLFFALMQVGAVLVPLPVDEGGANERLEETAAVSHRAEGERLVARDSCSAFRNSVPLYAKLRAKQHPGLVLFTSGTSGEPKAAVHDLQALCLRYRVPRGPARILAFMHIDHIGGVNTLLYCASNLGALVCSKSRSPEAVCQAIEQHAAEVLPTSPTFINLLITSGCLERYPLKSLKRITYGSEPMPATVLERLNQCLPGVELLQTYGTTELGILKSKSRDNGSLWMKVGGQGYDIKLVEGRLWIRAETAMLGYLNAPSPFDEQGYMDTGDEVEVDGDWIRIIGRTSESINVGGLKVAPVEVEGVLMAMPGVVEVAVRGESHPLTGQVVTATVRLEDPEESMVQFKTRMRAHCQGRLGAHAVPVRIRFAQHALVTDRFKRSR